MPSGIKPDHLLHQVIKPSLEALRGPLGASVTDPRGEYLLLGTACHESLGGFYLVQEGGPALGIYQIEPDTHFDIWDNWLAYRPEVASRVRGMASQHLAFEQDLVSNLRYQTAIARLVYWRSSFQWPSDERDIEAYARIWKSKFNTHLGKGKEKDFISHFPTSIFEHP